MGFEQYLATFLIIIIAINCDFESYGWVPTEVLVASQESGVLFR